MTAIQWFRRDLRRADNPALLAALASGGGTLALYVIDPALWGPAGDVRRWWLVNSLRALDESLGGRLLVRHGDPRQVVPAVAAEVGAHAVHIAGDFGPYGQRRDVEVREALVALGAELVATGSSYAVGPGRVTKSDGTRYAVFTPFHRAWLEHGWPRPAPDPGPELDLIPPGSVGSGTEPLAQVRDPGVRLPPIGEAAASAAWRRFRETALDHYPRHRDRPDLDGTSRLSVHLKWGEIHPRTLLADLGTSRTERAPDGDGARAAFRRQLAWREFYADVLAGAPESARQNLRPTLQHVRVDSGPIAEQRLSAWREGRTGYPFVDAGMRQLLATGWLHNRLRMIVASFLIKDLHLPWQLGAAHFMRLLGDADLANNQHGWQWVAGTGTDAAPYYRVFNPVLQGVRFDPTGDFVRRFVPELRHLEGAAVHQPWLASGGLLHGYPQRIVDHADERAEALRRLSPNRA